MLASSDAGMPSISVITRNGSGKARSAITSISASVSVLRATAASSMSSTIACTRGASCSTIRGREHLLHQPAQAGVVGRIEVEDLPGAPLRPVAQDLLPHLGPGVGADHAAVLDAQRRVAQQPDGVVVAEQRPEAERRALHRVGGAELGVLRVRILGEARRRRD